MAKKMLFNVNEPEEIRGAIVDSDSGKLYEYDIETRLRQKNRNNIYRGMVVKLEPSIHAAFVEYGGERHGFLPFRNIHEDFWSRKPKGDGKRVRIDDVLKVGQPVLVQVEREAVDNKGAALTTYCTLPGRFLVLRPRESGIGISNKIVDQKDRQSLRDAMKDLKPPEGFGCIVRTAALGKEFEDLERELNYLLRLWKNIQQEAWRDPRVGIVFQDGDLIMRMIRDYYDAEIDEIFVDDEEAFERARSYFSAAISGKAEIKYYEGERPLFSAYQVELQIAQVYERRINLPSGGSICIDPTEALIAIDVNSGKTQSESGIEETALKTNLEAATEVARQLRLRDLGGLVVIDFIGMRLSKNVRRVERHMRQILKEDKARIRMGRISSSFGLLSISRQRIRDSKELGYFVSCPSCSGLGKIPNAEASALIVLRHLQDAAATRAYERVEATVPKDIALYLLNQKRAELLEMEMEFETDVTILEREGMGISIDDDLQFFRKNKQTKGKKPRRGRKFRRLVQAGSVLQESIKDIKQHFFKKDTPKSEPTQDEPVKQRPEREEPAPAPAPSQVSAPKRPKVQQSLRRYPNGFHEGFPWFLQKLTNTQPRPSKDKTRQPEAPKAAASVEGKVAESARVQPAPKEAKTNKQAPRERGRSRRRNDHRENAVQKEPQPKKQETQAPTAPKKHQHDKPKEVVKETPKEVVKVPVEASAKKSEPVVESKQQAVAQAPSEEKKGGGRFSRRRGGQERQKRQSRFRQPPAAAKDKTAPAAKEGGSLWSAEELKKIRRASEEEEKRVALVEHASDADSSEEQKQAAPQNGHKSPKATRNASQTGSFRRWSEEELSVLHDLRHLSVQEAQQAFKKEGFERSPNAFKNKFYSLKED